MFSHFSTRHWFSGTCCCVPFLLTSDSSNMFSFQMLHYNCSAPMTSQNALKQFVAKTYLVLFTVKCSYTFDVFGLSVFSIRAIFQKCVYLLSSALFCHLRSSQFSLQLFTSHVVGATRPSEHHNIRARQQINYIVLCQLF